MAQRLKRADNLARLCPAALEVLTFYSKLLRFQLEVWESSPAWRDLPRFRLALVELVKENGTEALCSAAEGIDDREFRRSLTEYQEARDTESVASFFARSVLQPYTFKAPDLKVGPTPRSRCQLCAHKPQVGWLTARGHGMALHLICSLCSGSWSYPRALCGGCGESSQERLKYHQSVQFPAVSTQTCDSCGRYIHLIDVTRDPDAIPEVDELAVLPLDLWARSAGYKKIQPNIAGI